MTDTDEDIVPNSFHKLSQQKNVYHTQSSNINKTSHGSYNNMMTSNFNMPSQFMGHDQRSMYSRRETSPTSLRNFPNSRMQFQQSYSQSAMSSRGSVYNARCRSPMSVRSIDSNVSVSATDIALAFKNIKFNKYDFRIIQEAYNTHMKNRMRRRISKRRNLKSFIKHCRRKSGGESGAEGSDSSISSDDCRSTRSAFCTENMPRGRSRLPKMDLNKFTTQVRENEIYKDCTENFKQNSLRNLLSVNSKTVNHSFMPHHNQLNVPYNHVYSGAPETHRSQCNKLQNATIVPLKDHLGKDVSSLPLFQRFNKSGVNPTYEISYKEKSKVIPQKVSANNKIYEESDNESDDIFPQSTSRLNITQSNNTHHKRFLETENSYPERKKKKLSVSPEKQNKDTSSRNIKKIVTKSKEFNFKKPQLPLKKTVSIVRSNEPEILIAKSSQPLVGNLEPISIQSKQIPQKVISVDVSKQTTQASQNDTDTINTNTVADTTCNTTDVSMRPSFIKRKLFTQALDIAENKNTSSDNLNSPHTKVLRTCREKNKVRKLTPQSCLSHDVQGENNYLDLIHKIVPPDQIKNQNLNNTNVVKKNQTSKSILDKDGKWDVTLAVSTCNNDNKSDTYTDEEIFNVPQKNKKKAPTNKDTDKKPNETASLHGKKTESTQCKVVVQKLPETFNLIKKNTEVREKQCPNKRTVMSCVKSFWDTDFESDIEDQKDQISGNSHFLMTNDTNCLKKRPRGTILSVRSARPLGMNHSIKTNGSEKTKVKSKMLDKVQEDKENNNDSDIMLNQSTPSCSKTKEAEMQNMKDNITDTSNLKNNCSKSEIQKSNKQKKSKPKTTSGTKNKKLSESIFNISRESLRQKKKRETSNKSPTGGNKCNTTRENLRLKQKREANLNYLSDSQFLRNDAKYVISPKNKPRGTKLSGKSFQTLGMNHNKRSNGIQNPEVNRKMPHSSRTLREVKETNNDSNMLNRSTRSSSKNKDAEIKNLKSTNKPKNNSNYHSKSKNQKSNKHEKPKTTTSSSIINVQKSQSIFNISRESLRQKQKDKPPANLSKSYIQIKKYY